MARKSKHLQPSQETQEEAMKIAKQIQKPGQSKEQTKLVAQGIQKGIQLYKKQYKEKTRAWDKQHKKTQPTESQLIDAESNTEMQYKQHPLLWLLAISGWAVAAVLLYLCNDSITL